MPDYTKKQYDLNIQAYGGANTGSSYSIDEGLLVIPIMGPVGSPPVIVRVHAGMTTRSAEFSYSKTGTPPIIPPPVDTMTGARFFGGTIALPAPGITSDGSLVYNIAGGYNFVHPNHLPITGYMYYDAYPYTTGIDGLIEQNGAVVDNNAEGGYYNSYIGQKFDMEIFGSYRILA